MTRVFHLSLTLALLTSAGRAGGGADPENSDLATGIRQAKEGDFEGALLTLDALARKLTAEPGRSRELAQAYLYLGVAYVGLDQPALAKAKFQQALERDKDLRLSTDEFAPKVLRVFEAAREAQASAAALEKQTKTKRGKAGLILLGVGGAAAAGIAVAATGGGSPPNKPPTTSFSIAPEGLALAGVTTMTLTASANDPDGDPLTYSWDFGDASRGAGATVTHVFDGEGTFNVVLTVADSRGGSVTANGGVKVRTVTGEWLVSSAILLDRPNSFDLLQSGKRLSGTAFRSMGGLIGVSGALADARVVTFTYSIVSFLERDFRGGPAWQCNLEIRGQFDSALETMAGTNTCVSSSPGRDFVPCPCVGRQLPVVLKRE